MSASPAISKMVRVRLGGLIGLALTLVAAAGATSSASASAGRPDAFGMTHVDRVVFPDWDSPIYGTPWMSSRALGDVNGDGTDDMGAYFDAGDNGPYVVFGARPGESLPALAQDRPGFVIPGAWSLDPVGDVNQDGRDDVAVTRGNDAFVVFGSASSAPVNLDALGSRGFLIRNYARLSAWNADNPRVAGVGDQDGDGAPDIALSLPGRVVIVYTPPSPAGAVVDLASLGDGGAVLRAPGAVVGPWVGGVLDDLDRDGFPEVLVSYVAGGDGHVVAAVTPPPGATFDLGMAAEQGLGFEYLVDGSQFVEAVDWIRPPYGIGDQDGDGIRDIAFWAQAFPNAWATVGPSLPLGSTAVVVSAAGRQWSRDAPFVDLGDQDGDGIGDVGNKFQVIFASTGLFEPTTSWDFDGLSFEPLPSFQLPSVVGALRDQNGDGRPEALLQNWRITGTSPHIGRYQLDVWNSSPVPNVAALTPPQAPPRATTVSPNPSPRPSRLPGSAGGAAPVTVGTSVSADRRAPTVEVIAPARAARLMRRVVTRGLRVKVRVSERATLDVALRVGASTARRLGLRSTTLGSVRVQAARKGTREVVVRLSRSARAALATWPSSVRGKLTIVAVDASGNRRTYARGVTVPR